MRQRGMGGAEMMRGGGMDLGHGGCGEMVERKLGREKARALAGVEGG